MGVKISELRHRIKFQSLSRTPDGQGGWTENWSDFTPPNHSAAELWAKVRPKSAKERYFAQQIQPTVTHEIIIRWLTGITEEMRIVFEGRIFQVHGKFREDEERWFIYIDAEEGVGS